MRTQALQNALLCKCSGSTYRCGQQSTTAATLSYAAGDDSYIAMYDGMNLDKIVKMADLKGSTAVGPGTGDTTGSLFAAGDLTGTARTDAATNGGVNAKLCSLFD